ncbi:thaumatin family protein [Facilibium subflavum]|uniref:thaumatin family protein n=1 Tax=Facilibium subflavum TaxID=2219058 RepID=UPI000E6542A5|nr:thaumatin family protein [Facilibium subflavum]
MDYRKAFILCAALSILSSASITSAAPDEQVISGINAKKSITIVNKTGQSQTFYFMVANVNPIPSNIIASFKALKPYPCLYTKGQGNAQTCNVTIPDGEQQVIPLSGFSIPTLHLDITGGKGQWPLGPCPTTTVEFVLNSNNADHYDVSLVNGQNFNVKVTSAAGGKPIILNTDNLAQILQLPGVFPPGCDGCAVSINPPTWPQCPGKVAKSSCKQGTQYNPNPVCQYDSQPISNSYTVTFTETGV